MYGKDVTFSGLEPVTQYEIRVILVYGRSVLLLETLTITTGESAPCRRPDGEGVILAEKEFYDKDEDLQVRCEDGYHLPSSSSYMMIRCTNPQMNDEWSPSPHCIAQCRRPDGEGVIPGEKEFYDQGENVEVRCKDGYRLLSADTWTQCINPRTYNEWDRSPQCIAQCRRPDGEGVIPAEKEFYDQGENVEVRCKDGY
ncbi:complement factor H-related protein 1-like [Phyllobates terribilis]|uniref:complement factor H-related protein 1-like n=1 Tax=Phyllobates terribilis TaxID=111132 RepID=UPI003CCB0ADF